MHLIGQSPSGSTVFSHCLVLLEQAGHCLAIGCKKRVLLAFLTFLSSRSVRLLGLLFYDDSFCKQTLMEDHQMWYQTVLLELLCIGNVQLCFMFVGWLHMFRFSVCTWLWCAIGNCFICFEVAARCASGKDGAAILSLLLLLTYI